VEVKWGMQMIEWKMFYKIVSFKGKKFITCYLTFLHCS